MDLICNTQELVDGYREQCQEDCMALPYDWCENVIFQQEEPLGQWIYEKSQEAMRDIDRNREHWIDTYNFYFDVFTSSQEFLEQNFEFYDGTVEGFLKNAAFILYKESYWYNVRSMVGFVVYDLLMEEFSTVTKGMQDKIEKHIDHVLETGIFTPFST